VNQFEFGQIHGSSPDLWGIRVERTNCEAKTFLRRRPDDGIVQQSAPGGCATEDWIVCYESEDWDASSARNTDTSPPADVWVNVRIDPTLNSTACQNL
jgi:hypothetical protein